ncbi:hypothetical protein DV737_g4169, partial [Chaetothyriales sp. CBS 132003]
MPSPVFSSYRQSLHVIFPFRPVSLYWAAPPPTPRQLAAARWFFETYSPRRLWTADQWRAQNQVADETLIPEVAFLGRSNVGKSSTLNALLNRPGLNPVGPRPGKTSVMTAWALAPLSETGGALSGFKGDTSTRLAVLDVPGYGYKSHATWGTEVTKYLSRRKHLKKIFVLVDANHGLVAKDWDMFQLLRKHGIPHQVVATKCDALLERNGARPPEYEDALFKIAHASQVRDAGELIAVGSRRKKDHDQSVDGIDHLRWSVLKATALDMFTYEMYSKLKQSKDFSDEQPAFNAPNLFKQPAWIGGASTPVMSALPLSNESNLPSGTSTMPSPSGRGQLPPSHPRASPPLEPTPSRPFSLRRGLDTLLNSDQPVSQLRPGDVTPSASSYNTRNSQQYSLPILSASSSSPLAQTAPSPTQAARSSKGASPLDEILKSTQSRYHSFIFEPTRAFHTLSTFSPSSHGRRHIAGTIRFISPSSLTDDQVLAPAIRPTSVFQIRSSIALVAAPNSSFFATWCLSRP